MELKVVQLGGRHKQLKNDVTSTKQYIDYMKTQIHVQMEQKKLIESHNIQLQEQLNRNNDLTESRPNAIRQMIIKMTEPKKSAIAKSSPSDFFLFVFKIHRKVCTYMQTMQFYLHQVKIQTPRF